MNEAFLLLFGLAPSLIWLSFYLRKDAHPEPNRMILIVFLGGMMVTVPTMIVELWLRDFFQTQILPLSYPIAVALYMISGVALVEEFFKYLVVRMTVFEKSVLDEPIDIILYMIIGALGFGALENILTLFGFSPGMAVSEILALTIFRFLGATFLHALASGMVGYFLALSFAKPQRSSWYFALGLGLAALLHGFFNFYILEGEGITKVLIPVAIVAGLAIFLSFAFRKVKTMKSIVSQV